jgi:hypothetical protein
MNEQELTERAKANVGFYRHLLMYVLTNVGLFCPFWMGHRIVVSLSANQII